jgi:putative flavoprotein involved in K+ transport
VIRQLRPAGVPAARTADVVVIGAGHAGLAISCCLSRRGIDHVVLERGDVAHAWRHERWDSLRLLTPNWQTRLPGHRYDGPDPDGFMTAADVGDFIDDYARRIDAPVSTGIDVTSVRPSGTGYTIVTNRGEWWCAAVVLASGACNVAHVPAVRAALPASIASVTPLDYRNPEQLEAGGVLVVGASATGVQLADEIQRSGRPVTLAVASHIRLPRTYRGLDIQRWMDAIGVLDERYDEVDDIVRARRVPSPQLVGTADRADLDVNALRARGVQVVGRLVGVSSGTVQFSGSLRNDCAMADLKMRRLLDRIDQWIANSEGVAAVTPVDRPAPTVVDSSPRLSLDVGSIRSVVWATGYRPDYRWLDVPVLDPKGRIRHDGGVADAPGLYVTGLTFLRRRKSSFIHGAEDDATDLSAHLADHLDRLYRRAAGG